MFDVFRDLLIVGVALLTIGAAVAYVVALLGWIPGVNLRPNRESPFQANGRSQVFTRELRAVEAPAVERQLTEKPAIYIRPFVLVIDGDAKRAWESRGAFEARNGVRTLAGTSSSPGYRQIPPSDYAYG